MQQIEETTWEDCICAVCLQKLNNPVQLKPCLHILCFECKQPLENSKTEIICPKCAKDSGRADLKLLVYQQSKICDVAEEHGFALWNCFKCGKNLCTRCSQELCTQDLKGHILEKLDGPSVTESRIREQASFDSSSQDWIQCPVCSEVSCEHVTLLQDLIHGQDNVATNCDHQEHKELRLFCRTCWTPICIDCTYGKHQGHSTDEIDDCWREFILGSLETCREKLQMLRMSADTDASEAAKIECQLGDHFTEIERKLKTRKKAILKDTTRAFDDVITASVQKGHNILTKYREKMNRINKFQMFLEKTDTALANINTNRTQDNMSHYARGCKLGSSAVKLVHHLSEEYKKLTKPEEQQLVLPEVKAIIVPPPPLARVGSEKKYLQLALSLALPDDYAWPESLVVTDTYECLFSVRKSREETDSDCFVRCIYDSVSQLVDFKQYDVDKGRYFLSCLQTGEIVASYSSCSKNASKYENSCSKNASKYENSCSKNASKYENSCSENASKYENAVLYFNGNFPMGRERLKFRELCQFQFNPYGIATTKDNNIVLCVSADEQTVAKKEMLEGKGLICVMLMSMAGKVLKEVINQPGANLMRPDYITVSDTGDICISDSENSSVIILDENLEIRDRMNYELSTSMQNNPFRPHGACYDSYGRIIVADPDNNCLVRLVRDPESKYKLEPLVSSRDEIPGFHSPRLVAMNKEKSQLWVLCPRKLFVFEYCT